LSALLEVEGLTTTFPTGSGRAAVVDGISFRIAEAEVLALVICFWRRVLRFSSFSLFCRWRIRFASVFTTGM
jgi:hypothetical protein